MRMRDGLSSRSPESTRGNETVTAFYQTLFLIFVYVSEFIPLQTLRHAFSS